MPKYTPRHAAPKTRGRRRATALSLTGLLALSMAPAEATDLPTDPAAAAATVYQDAPDILAAESFYTAPAVLPEANGALIKAEPFTFKVDANNVIAHPVAQAQRIMYKSTNFRGEAVAVTGTALTTTKPWRGPGERPIIALAPGTQGIGDACAPSNQFEAGTEYETLVLTSLLNAGYDVVVTDYIGLGTAGTHSYLNRVDQGNAVLDAARAVTQGGILGSATAPVGLWGYSQGGGAVASAGELQADYAPELNLKGIYAGAVPANLQAVTQFIDGGLYTGFSLMGMVGLADSYGVDITDKLNLAGEYVLEQTRHMCTLDAVGAFAFQDTRQLTISGKTISQEAAADAELVNIMTENSLGQQGRHPQVPILIASSWADDVIPYKTNRQLAKDYCQQGSRVTFYTLVGATHLAGVFEGIPRGLIFLDRQFKGLPSINSCWQF